MKNKRVYPHRSIFLLAAEKQLNAQKREFLSNRPSLLNAESVFSCINILHAADELGRRDSLGTVKFYRRYFKPKEFPDASWWPLDENNNWDYDSRIFALLLAAEMLRR